MNRRVLKSAVFFTLSLGGIILGHAYAGGAPGTGIAGTAHDFSGKPAGSAVTGLCTFCHTPHRAIVTPQLQNHTLSLLTFRWCDRTRTSNGTPLPTIPPTHPGPSRICLGCHSGTVTAGDVNWFNGRSWTGAATLDNVIARRRCATPQGCISHPHNNHPVALPYPYLGTVSTYNGVTNNAAVLGKFVPDPTVNGIRLFREEAGRIVNGPAAGRTGIECSSCHDPHNGRTVQGRFFLRGTRMSLCQKCHVGGIMW